jgi:hypothetical protein
VIPNVVHFAYFYESDFPLYAYLAIKSAAVVLKPDEVFLYRSKQAPDPTGKWWKEVQPLVTIKRIEPPTEIFGNLLIHPAHQADVFRLQVLLAEGGIYLDIDTICRAPFTRLRGHEMVMGSQTADREYGLCNAVMLAAPGAAFLQLWLEEYTSFRSRGRDEYWDEHSVRTPLALLKLKKAHINVHIEPHSTFFDPGWQRPQLKKLFEQSHNFPDSVCHHLWASHSAANYLLRLAPSAIQNVDTSYNVLARRFLPPQGEP